MATSKLHALWNHPAGPKTSPNEKEKRKGKKKKKKKKEEEKKKKRGRLFVNILKNNRVLEIKITFPLKLGLVLLVHFWAPTFKWGISIANIADFQKPPENLSYPQQIAVACTGLIWSRYSMVVKPKNWNLFSVNVAMAGTGLYQLSRKIRCDYGSEAQAVIAKDS